MKIVSWNVNGIRACYKKGLIDFIETEEPDILCLQETKAHIDQVEPEAQNLGYEYFDWSSAIRKGYSGVATFSTQKPKLVKKGWGQNEYDSEGRILWSEYPDFDLYNIYFPNGGSSEERHNFKQKFLSDLNQHLKSELNKKKNIVVLGDYNVAHREIDVYDPIKLSKISGFFPEERKWFSEFLDLGFIDTFRFLHPHDKDRYSWWSYKELARTSNRGWRIDCISVSKSLESKIKSADILDSVEGSDHCPVTLELEF
jgi:exodeoxyribonuclease-3